MRQHVRALCVTGGLAATLLLAGCDKPAPKVTVQTGSFSTTITASTYCFDTSHCRNSSGIDLPVVTAAAQGSILVDVPAEVVDTGWAVNALTLDGAKALGSSGTIHDSHSYRLVSNAGNGQPFIVEVEQVRHGRPDGSRWSFLVRVSQTS